MTVYKSRVTLGDVVMDYAVLREEDWKERPAIVEMEMLYPFDGDRVQIVLDCKTGRKTSAGTLQNYTIIFEDGLPRAVRNGVPGGRFWPAAKLRNFGQYDLRDEEFEHFNAERFMEMYAQAMPVVKQELQRAYLSADEDTRRMLRKTMRYGAGFELDS